MDTRNITRLYNFRSALIKYNKKSCFELNLTRIYILYTLYQIRGCTFSRLNTYLKGNHHTISKNKLHKYLKEMIIAGVVQKETCYRVPLYYITVYGMNDLKSLEKAIRIQRVKKL